MLEKLFWFGLGYFTARWIILKYGTDEYMAKESALIGAGKEKVQQFQQQIMPEEQIIQQENEILPYTEFGY